MIIRNARSGKKHPREIHVGAGKHSGLNYFTFPSLLNFTDCVVPSFFSSTSKSPLLSL
jgi:hypothetical protein